MGIGEGFGKLRDVTGRTTTVPRGGISMCEWRCHSWEIVVGDIYKGEKI